MLGRAGGHLFGRRICFVLRSDPRGAGCLKTSIRPSAKACGVLESAAYAVICEHLQKPHNTGSRPQAQFFNTLLKPAWGAFPAPVCRRTTGSQAPAPGVWDLVFLSPVFPISYINSTECPTTVEGNPSAVNGNAHRSLLLVRILLGLIPLAAGLYVIAIGQDTNWDLRNYHFYNPFAYLTGRMGHDVAVSHVATYYNPLMYIPFYYAVTARPRPRPWVPAGGDPGVQHPVSVRHCPPGDRPRPPGPQRVVLPGGSTARPAGAEQPRRDRHELRRQHHEPAGARCRVADRAVPGPAGRTRLGRLGSGRGRGAAIRRGVRAQAAVFGSYCVGLCAALFGLAMPLRRRFLLAFVFGLGCSPGRR